MKTLWVATMVAVTALQTSAEVPRYPGTTPIPIGDELTIGGERFQISYFTTAEPVSAVAEYFFDQWKTMGLPTMADGHPEAEMVVSAFYTREGLQQAVVLRRRSDKTIGFATVRDLWFQAGAAEPDDLFSPPEGVVWLHDVESRDAAARARHRTGLVESNFQTAVEGIKGDLSKKGYLLAREATVERGGRRQLRLEHTRGERRLLTHVAELEGGATAVVQTCFGCVVPPAASPRRNIPAMGRPLP